MTTEQPVKIHVHVGTIHMYICNYYHNSIHVHVVCRARDFRLVDCHQHLLGDVCTRALVVSEYDIYTPQTVY